MDAPPVDIAVDFMDMTDEPGPEAPVVGHVHEVDSDVDRRGVHVAQG